MINSFIIKINYFPKFHFRTLCFDILNSSHPSTTFYKMYLITDFHSITLLFNLLAPLFFFLEESSRGAFQTSALRCPKGYLRSTQLFLVFWAPCCLLFGLIPLFDRAHPLGAFLERVIERSIFEILYV